MQQPAIIRLVIRLSAPQVLANFGWHSFVNHFVYQRARLLALDDLVAIAVNDLALIIHHIVHIERALPNEIIALLNPLLRSLDRFI